MRARQRACTVVNESVSGPLRVEAGSAGFTVRTATGRTVLAPTLTAVWAEVLRSGRVDLQHSPRPHGSAVGAPVAAEVASGQLVLAVADGPELARLVTSEWPAPRLLAWTSRTTVEEVVTATSGARLVLAVAGRDLGDCLARVTQPVLRLHTTVAAVVHDGQGPAWATDVRGLGPARLHAVLEGCPPHSRHHELGLPEAAAWLSGQVMSGATTGRRVTVAVDGGRWMLDAADGHGLAVRRVPDDDQPAEALAGALG